jgi:hypothetical protein
MRKACYIFIVLAVCSSCKKEDDPVRTYPPPFPSRGYAIEYYTGNPVPDAFITVIKPGLFGSTVISSFQADADGEFQVKASWSQYSIKALDPYPFDIYNYGFGYGEIKGDSLVCILSPVGWIRYFVNDTLPLNPEITEISFGPAGTDGSMQYNPPFYPAQYNVNSGYVIPATSYQNYSIPFKFITGNDGITGNDSLWFLSVFTPGFDTLDIHINY